MLEFSRLLRVLEKELRCQEQLLGILAREREAIVKVNQENLHALRLEKEALVEECTALGSRRQELVSSLLKALGRDAAEGSTFAEIIENCQDLRLRRSLSDLKDKLQVVVPRVKKLNDANGLLLKQSLGFIASVVSIMRSQPEKQVSTYGPKGLMQGDDSPFSAPRKTLSQAV